jgi:hypothetical protein
LAGSVPVALVGYVQIPSQRFEHRGASGMESLAIGLIWFAMACGLCLGCYAAYCLVVDPDSEIENVK